MNSTQNTPSGFLRILLQSLSVLVVGLALFAVYIILHSHDMITQVSYLLYVAMCVCAFPYDKSHSSMRRNVWGFGLLALCNISGVITHITKTAWPLWIVTVACLVTMEKVCDSKPYHSTNS